MNGDVNPNERKTIKQQIQIMPQTFIDLRQPIHYDDAPA